MIFVGITEDFEIFQFEVIEDNEKDKIIEYLQKDSFYPLSQEAYNFCMCNNSARVNNTDTIVTKMNEYKNTKNLYLDSLQAEEEITEDGKKSNKKITIDSIIDIDNLTTEKIYFLDEVIANKIRKNKILCGEMITFGITYNGKHYSYTVEDQLNFEEKIRLIDKGILNDETKIQLKTSDSVSEMLSVKEFTTIYKKLMYNKYYNMCYLTVFNEYLATLTDVNLIERMTYEVYLPEEYQLKLKELLIPYKQYRDEEEI